MASATASVADQIAAINNAALRVTKQLAFIRSLVPSADREELTLANMIEGQKPTAKHPKRPPFFYVAKRLVTELNRLRDDWTLWPVQADAAWRSFDLASAGQAVRLHGTTAANLHEAVATLADGTVLHFEALEASDGVIELIRSQMEECDKVKWGEHVLHNLVPDLDGEEIVARLKQEAAIAFTLCDEAIERREHGNDGGESKPMRYGSRYTPPLCPECGGKCSVTSTRGKIRHLKCSDQKCGWKGKQSRVQESM